MSSIVDTMYNIYFLYVKFQNFASKVGFDEEYINRQAWGDMKEVYSRRDKWVIIHWVIRKNKWRIYRLNNLVSNIVFATNNQDELMKISSNITNYLKTCHICQKLQSNE